MDYEYVTDASRLGHIAQETVQSSVIALDLETCPKERWRHKSGAALSPHLGQIRLCSINTLVRTYVIDLFHTKTLGPLADVLHNPTAQLGAGHPICVLQNAKFDQSYLLVYFGIELWPVFDTFRASYMLHNGKRMGHNLYDIYARELSIGPQAPDLGGSDWGASVLSKEQLDYAAEDVIWLPKIREVQRPKLQQAGLMEIAKLEFGAVLPEASVEVNGLGFNKKRWLALTQANREKSQALARQLLRELPNPKRQMLLPGAEDWIFGPDVLEAWATSEEGDPVSSDERKQLARNLKPRGKRDPMVFNMDSSEQMLRSLKMLPNLKELLSEDQYKDFHKLDSTGEMALAPYLSRIPTIAKMFEYRGYATKVKMFGAEYLEYVNPETGRIHPNYFPMLVTGRYASRHPNLGQVPREKEFRECFEAPEGKTFVLADYSGIEMRLAAQISGDTTLSRLFRENIDPHQYTASRLLGKPEAEITKAERQQAKPCIAAGQLVLTDHGLKPIEYVELTDKVWDGVEWVNHEGVVYKGYKEVITYDGLTATPCHEVFLEDGARIPFREAARSGRRLAVGGDGPVPVGFTKPDRFSDAEGVEARTVRGVPVRNLQDDLLALSLQHPVGEDYRLLVSTEREVQQRSTGRDSRRSLRRDIAAMPGTGERTVQELWGSWDRASIRIQGALHSLDVEGSTPPYLQGGADRPEGQRWALRAGESSVGFAEGEPSQQAYESLGGLFWGASAACRSIRSDQSRLPGILSGESDCSKVGEFQSDTVGAGSASSTRQSQRSTDAGSQFAHVYDIVNAGPKHRYVVENIVVSNCNFGFIYGLGAEKFVLYAMTGYGVKLTLPQAKDFRKRFFDTYTGIQAWHSVALNEGKRTRMSRTPLGRIRHMDEFAHNEYLNNPVQGAGADGLKLALREVYFRAKKYGGRVRLVHHVHDEVITEVDDDKALIEAWSAELKEGMETAMATILNSVPVVAEPANGKTWAAK